MIYDHDARGPIRVSIDQGVDLKALRSLQRAGVVVLMQVHDLEQVFRGVERQGKAFSLGESTLDGPDMLAGDDVIDVQAIVGAEHTQDFQHVYAAALNDSEYFLTENPREFIANGKREKLEALLGLKIRRTAEFLEEIQRLLQHGAVLGDWPSNRSNV